MTLERFQRSGARGVAYNYWAHLLDNIQTTVSPTDAMATSHESTTTSLRKSGGIASLAAVGSTWNTTNDARQDAEPAVTAVRIGTNDYTVAATIKYVNGVPTNHVSWATNSGTFSTPVQLPIPAGYTFSADPVLAVNPYTTGIAPKRIYCVGLLANPLFDEAPSAVAVWRTDDGGQTWAGPSIVNSIPGGGHYLDKPWITVSWHGSSLGNVYVTFVNLDQTGEPASLANTSLWVYRSTDGGLTFPTASVIAIDDLHGPSVAVNPYNGRVHVTWLSVANNDLRSAYSTNYGVSFGPHEVAADGNLLTRATGVAIGGGIRAWSLPMTKFNWAANRLVLVYHAWGPANTTEIYYTYRPCSSQCNISGWENPRQINDVSTNDQFFPAIDFNATGNMVVAFYDRRNDPSDISYDDYFAYINPDGTPIHGNIRISTYLTDPRRYTAQTGAASFVGDYRDLWDWTYSTGEAAVAARIGIPAPSGPGDMYVTRITY